MRLSPRHFFWVASIFWLSTGIAPLGLVACGHSSSSEGRRSLSPNETIDRLAAFKEETPARYGLSNEPALTRFLFELEDVPDASIEGQVAREFAWSKEVARLATFASIERATAWSERVLEGATTRNEAIETALWKAVELAPRAWPLYEELADFYEENYEECNESGLRRTTERWGDLRDAVHRLGSIVTGCPDFSLSALEEYPDDLGVLAALVHRTDRQYSSASPISLAARRRAVEISQQDQVLSAAQRDEVTVSNLSVLLVAGAVDAALSFYDELDHETQKRILTMDISATGFPRGDQKIDATPQEALSLELAAALALRGRTAEARALFQTRHSRSTDHDFRDAMSGSEFSRSDYASGGEACRRLIDASLDGMGDDPFDLLIEVGGLEAFGLNRTACRHSPTWRSLLGRIAHSSKYFSIARLLTEDEYNPLSETTFQYFEENHGELLGRLPDSLAASYRMIDRALRVPDVTPRPAVSDPSSLLSRIEGLAAEPFEEHPLPGDLPSQIPLKEEIEAWLAEQDLFAEATPSDIVREETRGELIVRISANQSYDPMGEVGIGGYWLHLSRNGGETWSSPIYTGLRSRFPYIVRAQSALPMLQGDRLSLEVAIDEVETQSITFPPIGLVSKRRREGIYVTASLEQLTRDSDGDGLTDLAEYALLLDPKCQDSDGDGLIDEHDSLPHVPRGPGDKDRAAALAAALPAMFGAGLKAHVIPPSFPKADDQTRLRAAMGTSPSAGEDWTLFLVADRHDFRSLEFDKRVVVLTAEEADALEATRGVFYPARISLFVLDTARETGILIWGASWTGGTIRLRKVDGVWSAEVSSSWIT